MREHRILVRADGGKAIGLGHWSRCMFLISCIETKTSVTLFTSNASEFKKVFPDSAIRIQEIAKEEDLFAEVSVGDLVIADDYKLDGQYVNQLSDLGAYVVFIDDLFKEGIKSDVLINHCPGIDFSQYKNSGAHTSYLLGADYSLIAGDFSPSGVSVENRIERVLLCMGGADPNNYTLSTMEELMDVLLQFTHVDILVGGMYAHMEKLEEICRRHQTFKLHSNLNKQGVNELMQHAGVAVMSASTMALEYAHVGGLLVIKETADNQRYLFNGLLKTEVAIEMDSLANGAYEKSSLYEKLAEQQRKIFDGNGKTRFTKLFREFDIQRQVTLRKATFEDIDLTFGWASDKKIRAFSFSKEEITRDSHVKWFQKKISVKDCLYYIAFLKDSPVGSVRFDITGGTATISYLVDAHYHGSGMGRVLLVEGIKKLVREFYELERIVGYVLDPNIPSVKIFERLGFKRDEEDRHQTGVIKFYKEVQK